MHLKDIFTRIISACALKKKFDRTIGIYADTENIFCVNLELINSEEVEHWKVIDTAEVTINDDNYILDSDENLQDLVAERIAALIKDRGWQTNCTALSINSDKIIIDVENLSNIPKDKIPASVQYQIAVAGNFEADTYLSSFLELDEEVWMEGIAKVDASKWSQAFQNRGLELLALTAIPYDFERIDKIDLRSINEDFLKRGGMNAVFAANSLVHQTNPNFFLDKTTELNGWNFARINVIIVVLTFLVISGIAAFDFWNYKQAEAALEYEREKFRLLEPERRKEEEIEEGLEKLRKKNQILTSLREDSFNWRKLLIYFGSVKIQGVWLKELHALDNGKIELKGEATSYELMKDYFRALENDRDIFSNVEFKGAASNSSGQLIQFTIWLSL